MDSLSGGTLWHIEPIGPDLVQGVGLRHVLYAGHTPYQRVELLETGPFGRALVLDGKTQSAEADEFVYHEALVQPVMVAHTHPQQVFIAGGGEGATAREVLRHRSVERLVMVDLDAQVVDLCRQYLPGHHAGAFDDPRLHLHHQDAMAYLDSSQEQFDLVIIDVPDPLEGGPAYLLYTQEFYRLVRSHLKPGGFMVAQAGPAGVLNHKETFTAVHRTMGSVFAQVFPYRVHVPSFGTPWGFVIGALDESTDVVKVQPEVIDQRVQDRVGPDLRYYDGGAHAGLFALPKYLREALEVEQRLITKDTPLYAV